ncbi:MAG: nucleotidyltransferase family protein [Solirubrobacteraceae bacterium]
MAIDAATAELFSALGQAGARARLLKGPSIARWLYHDPDDREYGDCDVLIAPEWLADAERALDALGYEREYDDRSLPDWWREHASAWLRHRDGVSVDLHRTLVGVGVPDPECWQLLSADPGSLRVGGIEVLTLNEPARMLHVALHAAQHGAGRGQGIQDLNRTVERGDDQVWRDTAGLARSLHAEDALAAGLALCESGRALATRLELPGTGAATDARLRAAGVRSPALTFETLASADGLRARAAIVWHKLVPPAEFMRHWDPAAERGGARLLWAYVRRPAWVLRQAPAGLRAWQRARSGGGHRV